ncbi:MAG: glycosyltransferase 4 family protein [Thermoprotei archaeon]
MHNPILLVCTALSCLVGLLIALYTIKWWIKRARELGFTGKDMNKYGEVYVAEAGGVWVSIAAAFSILFYIAFAKYNGLSSGFEEKYMALTLLLFMSSFLGFLDDLLGWKKGLRVVYRIVLMAPLSIPLVVIKAGYSKMTIPLLGTIDFGLAYPLVLVPIGVLGAANAFNMLAGYNGLEALQGIQLMVFTAIFSILANRVDVAIAAILMIPPLLGFLRYNWYPARVFPGNAFTYGIGAYYASLIILGNMEKFGVMLFTLYFVELLLFLRGLRNGVYKENFGKPHPDGTLDPPYSKSYSLTHLAIKLQIMIRGKATEKGVVVLISILQLVVGIASLIIARII